MFTFCYNGEMNLFFPRINYLQGLGSVVSTTDRIGGCQNGRSGIQGCVNTSLGNTNRLLFHSFVNGDLVFNVHFVKFINTADALHDS